MTTTEAIKAAIGTTLTAAQAYSIIEEGLEANSLTVAEFKSLEAAIEEAEAN